MNNKNTDNINNTGIINNTVNISNTGNISNIYSGFGISDRLFALCCECEKELSDRFADIDRISEYNQLKVINAMQENHASEACLTGTTGYGYNDTGRDRLENIFADIFKTEDALVRSQIVCGTHALAVALSGNTRPGDGILSPAGLPYDTLHSVIGIRPSTGSLAEYGVGFSYVDLLPDGKFDYEGIRKAIRENTKLIEIQRSRGYSERHSFSVGEIAELIEFLRTLKDDLIILVDNCYGEFTELTEPSEAGADMIVGSLIKNPGGGIAPVGGYIAGTAKCVENAAARLTAPGLLKELGPSLDTNRLFYQGLFMAPAVTAAAEKGAVLASLLLTKLGFKTSPEPFEKRSDIVQSVCLNDREHLISFCKGVQEASCIDSFVSPVPTSTPGYAHDVIMAAGCFVSGSSIELSCDGPLREPFNAFFQGGLNYTHSKLGVLKGISQMIDDGLLKI